MPNDTSNANEATPSPESQTGEAKEAKDKKDLLNTPAPEAAEMDALLNAGLQAHNRIGFLTFIGVILIIAGVLFWRTDRITGDRAYADILDQAVRTQADKDYRAYRMGEDAYAPKWPIEMYQNLREQIFGIAALTLALAFVFLFIERARMRRSDVLVYRAMAREIEKLRLRVKQLEGKKGKAGMNDKGEEESATSDDKETA